MLASVFVALFIASVVVYGVLTDGSEYPTPFRGLGELQAHYERYPEAIMIASWLLFGAAIPLGLFTATMVSRLFFHRVRVAGVHIALFGGIAAALLLAASGLVGWTLSQPGVADDTGAMRAVQLTAFTLGGVGHTVALGLLLAGISVPSLMFGLMPRWLCWYGLVAAAIAELSWFSLVVPELTLLLPLARVLGYVWLIIAGFSLPNRAYARAAA